MNNDFRNEKDELGPPSLPVSMAPSEATEVNFGKKIKYGKPIQVNRPLGGTKPTFNES